MAQSSGSSVPPASAQPSSRSLSRPTCRCRSTSSRRTDARGLPRDWDDEAHRSGGRRRDHRRCLGASATVASTPLAAEQATAPGSPLVSPVAGLVAAFVVAALVGVAVTLLLSGRRESVRERVALFTEADDEEDGEGPNEGGLARLADRWLSGASWWRRFHLDYEIANFGWTPGRTVMAGLAGALTLGALLAASTSLPLLILAPTVLVPPIVWMIVRFRAVRERRRFAEQLADHLAVVAGALRA